MGPIARITAFLALNALVQGCSTEKGLAGPGAPKRVLTDAAAEEQPSYGPWSTPVNLGAIVNSAFNENHPAISKDGLSLYITSGRPGGVNGVNLLQFEEIWVSQRATRRRLGGAGESRPGHQQHRQQHRVPHVHS